MNLCGYLRCVTLGDTLEPDCVSLMTMKTGKSLSAVALLLLAASSYGQTAQPVEDTSMKPNPLGSMRDFEPPANAPYELGPGDSITVTAVGRPEITGKQVIGPDGTVTIPIAGSVKLSGLTRDQAAGAIEHALDPFYTDISVSVEVDKYVANQVVVLGAVMRPGIVTFDNQPTLLGAIARANGGGGGGEEGGYGGGGGGGGAGGGGGSTLQRYRLSDRRAAPFVTGAVTYDVSADGHKMVYRAAGGGGPPG